MDEPVAEALKFAFLGVLYLFLLWVARSSLRDLARAGVEAPHPEPPVEEQPARREQPAGPDLAAGVDPRLEVIAAMGFEPGTQLSLEGGITLGRSDSAEVRIDDPFASSVHARIFPRGHFMYIEDMGSTNGTYLNGRQLRRPEQLKVADVVRIGDSEYRYQE